MMLVLSSDFFAVWNVRHPASSDMMDTRISGHEAQCMLGFQV